jgi:hypothetical protein
MRRLLVSLGLAVIVGGSVLGAAAALQINPYTLSAGSANVQACDPDGIEVLFGATHWNGSYFEVGWVEAQHVAARCFGNGWSIVLTHDGVALGQVNGNTWYGDGSPGPTGDNNFFSTVFNDAINNLHIDAAAVNDVHIAIYGP